MEVSISSLTSGYYQRWLWELHIKEFVIVPGHIVSLAYTIIILGFHHFFGGGVLVFTGAYGSVQCCRKGSSLLPAVVARALALLFAQNTGSL